VRGVLDVAGKFWRAGEANLDQMLVRGTFREGKWRSKALANGRRASRAGDFLIKRIRWRGRFFGGDDLRYASRLGEAQRKEIEKCAVDAARALGLSHGRCNAEFRINEEECGRWKWRRGR